MFGVEVTLANHESFPHPFVKSILCIKYSVVSNLKVSYFSSRRHHLLLGIYHCICLTLLTLLYIEISYGSPVDKIFIIQGVFESVMLLDKRDFLILCLCHDLNCHILNINWILAYLGLVAFANRYPDVRTSKLNSIYLGYIQRSIPFLTFLSYVCQAL